MLHLHEGLGRAEGNAPVGVAVGDADFRRRAAEGVAREPRGRLARARVLDERPQRIVVHLVPVADVVLGVIRGDAHGHGVAHVGDQVLLIVGAADDHVADAGVRLAAVVHVRVRVPREVYERNPREVHAVVVLGDDPALKVPVLELRPAVHPAPGTVVPLDGPRGRLVPHGRVKTARRAWDTGAVPVAGPNELRRDLRIAQPLLGHRLRPVAAVIHALEEAEDC
mmetsp:Transcript_16503/g.47591  ORF Transcript_16503/g.47591 Transcript_16503/m.47591 type:complete len:224 (+) Transcript_16503:733-1404(+)